MAQKYKEYDKKYRKSQHTFMAFENNDTTFNIKGAEYTTKWPRPFSHLLNQPEQDVVQRCVYHSGFDSEVWQWFRVSLKGFSTKEKIYRLVNYLCTENLDIPYNIRYVQVANYLGALKRGGFIDGDGEILK